MKNNAIRFGRVLKRLRKTHRMKQLALALEIGTCQAQISAYERGAAVPSLSTISRIANAFGVEFRIGETIEVMPRGGAV